jgi:hypothetical protein
MKHWDKFAFHVYKCKTSAVRPMATYGFIEGDNDIQEEAEAVYNLVAEKDYDLANFDYDSINTVMLLLVEHKMTSLAAPWKLINPRPMKTIFTTWVLYWRMTQETTTDPMFQADARNLSFNRQFSVVFEKLAVLVNAMAEFDRDSVTSNGAPPVDA